MGPSTSAAGMEHDTAPERLCDSNGLYCKLIKDPDPCNPVDERPAGGFCSMPTYEYECSQCGKTFDHFQSMKADPLTDCLDEACAGKGTMKRLIGAGSGLIFKGSGFYITDYKKSGEGGGEESGDKSGATEAKSDKKKSGKDSKSGKTPPPPPGGKASSKSKPDTPSGS